MKPVTALRIGLYGSMASAVCAMAPSALADTLGSPVDVGGGDQWTVSNLRPSADAIPYRPAGSLWEATATNQIAGGGVPVVPGFTAHGGGVSYPVLWGVASAQGINPAALPPGGQVSGKLYFDVTSAPPTAVAYYVDGRQVADWVQPPPVDGGAPAAYGVPRAVTPAPAAGTPMPAAAGSSGTPAPAAAGSSGTPAPAAAGSSGTPLTAEGSTAPSTAGATPSTAAPSTSATPAQTGSSGTPVTAEGSTAPSAAAATPRTASPASPSATAPAPTSTAAATPTATTAAS